MESGRFNAGLGVGVLTVLLSSTVPTLGTGCTEAPPFVCTTTSESFFYGITSGQPRRIIDFETLPNGQPSVGSTFLAPNFNYTSSGVTFSVPLGLLGIGGAPGHFGLVALAGSPVAHTWIRSDFVHPSNSVGIWFPGVTMLTAFDAQGSVIASQAYGASGGPWFIGIYSDVPIAYVTIDRGSDSEFLNDFIFSLVPEPASVFFLMAGIGGALAGRRRN